MIKKISVAGMGAILLAASVMPVGAFTLPDISANVNYGQSASAAAANTGGNFQSVGEGVLLEQTSRGSYGHKSRGGSESQVNVSMETGDATARSNSNVVIDSKASAPSSNYGGFSRYSRRGGSSSDLNVNANIGLSTSSAIANTGENTQLVTPQPNSVPAYSRYGGHHSQSSNENEVNVEMTTGDAKATSESNVVITSVAGSVSRSRHH